MTTRVLFIFLLLPTLSFADEFVLRVTSETGEPVAGVQVTVDGTTVGVAPDGSFQLPASPAPVQHSKTV